MASAMIRLCSCGFGTDNPAWLEAHLFENPGHHERTLSRYLRLVTSLR